MYESQDQYIQDRLAFPTGRLGFLQAVRAQRDLREHGATARHEYVDENWD